MRQRSLLPNGDYSFGTGLPFLVDTPDCVAQAIMSRMRLETGEWFLDLAEGTDFEGRILGYGTLTTRDLEIRTRILDTPGVVSILQYASFLDADRRWTVLAVVDTLYGPAPLVVNENIAPPVLTTAFIGSPLTGTNPLAVAFTDQSSPLPAVWAWDFGDGNTSAFRNPNHTYAAAGTYTVTLQVTQGGVPQTPLVKPNYVTVTNPGPPPISSLFRTVLYTGDGTTNRLVAGLDISAGGFAMIRARNSAIGTPQNAEIGVATDGATTHNSTFSGSAAGNNSATPNITLESGGVRINDPTLMNVTGVTYVIHMFKFYPGFVEVAQYTGNGVASNQTHTHTLGLEPAMMLNMRADSTHEQGFMWMKGIAQGNTFPTNSGNGAFSTSFYGDASAPLPDASTFSTFGAGAGNASGAPYWNIMFAHDPSPTGYIQMRSYAGNVTFHGPDQHLGWVPQFIWGKNNQAGTFMTVVDSARGLGTGADPYTYSSNDYIEQVLSCYGLLSDGYYAAHPSADFNQGVMYNLAVRAP